MELRNTITNSQGKVFNLVYRDNDPIIELQGKALRGVQALCFYEDKLVIVYEKNTWNVPGGTIEAGESYEQATVREVKEETNMKVLSQEYIGCNLYTTEEGKEIRHVYSFCAVEPYGAFITDPDGDVSKIDLIDPKDVSKYIEGWAVIGEEIMRRAVEMKNAYNILNKR